VKIAIFLIRGNFRMTRRTPCAPGWRGLARHGAVFAMALGCVFGARAQPAAGADAAIRRDAPPQADRLERVEVLGRRHYDNAVGTSDAASQGTIRADLLESRPLQRPGELLEFVPGVVVTQHSGDGKANQYFLRGFNLDHGTDFATFVDGVPVNMPSHAHGQGYADLGFLIPELVERIEYRKGPYFASSGNFASAGSAHIRYRSAFDRPFAAVSIGAHGDRRIVGGGSTEVGDGITLLGALAAQSDDGPWSVPERLRRVGAVLMLSGGSRAQGWRATLSTHESRWTATDQIPLRLIEAGTWMGRPFGRYDSLDPTDGGSTRRTSLSGEWHRQVDTRITRVAAWLVDYRLDLYSNFTYALERPAQGDQFAQRDARVVAGFTASHAFGHRLGALAARSEFGVQLRHDRIRVGLFDAEARRITATTRDDRVLDTLLGLYAQTSVALAPGLRAVAGVRADQASFRVDDRGGPAGSANAGSAAGHQLSPKLSLIAGPWLRTEFFLNAGRGFHANDARGTTATVDPRTGQPVDRVPALVSARGAEVGVRTELARGLQSSLALWRLDLDSELVYVGDAGTTEPSRASRRHGVEWSNRYLPLPWLLLDADLAWTQARFRDDDPAGRRIPNAVRKVASLALTVRELGPWSASVHLRYRGTAPLVEDDSVRAAASLTTSLRLRRALVPGTELFVDVFNLFDRKVDDIAYYYASQLPGEAAPVADRHFHPARPRSLRLTLRTVF
jgi:hypothetical protein